MYAVIGITGQVGGNVARTLLAAKQPVRAIMRNQSKAETWAKLGCEIAIAEIADTTALTAAFKETEGVFIVVPPNFDPSINFSEARQIGAALKSALCEARPAKVVYLSTIGAQATQQNLLTQHTIIENILSDLPMPITFLRPAWFMENLSWDLPCACEKRIIQSFLQPLEKKVPMVATSDIGRVGAHLLQEKWSNQRVIELEGPQRVSPNDIAAAFTQLLGRPIQIETVPRETWEALFKSQGMQNPNPRMQMLDGFNEGWIDFEGGKIGSLKGAITLEAFLKPLIEQYGQRAG
ncbi:MAG: NmrA family NAD(P)-binding protein [Gammaproteobacteria bacterium]|nr:NmrA family NAD(P)-binding protein [Gammaproteobacteria bacterium]